MRLSTIPFRFALLLALAASLSLEGCGRKKPEAPAAAPAPAKPEQAQQAPPPPPPAPKKPAIVDHEEGTMTAKISNRSGEEDLPKVEIDSSNIVVQKKEAKEEVKKSYAELKHSLPVLKVPSSCLAAKLSDGKSYQWSPMWRFKGVGGVWLPDMQVSDDGSVLAILETTGKDEGPYGTRIVLWGVYDVSIIKIVEIPERFIKSVAFVPGGSLLACLCEKQQELKQAPCVALVDLVDGQISSISNPLAKPAVSLACSSKAVYATLEDTPGIVAFDVKDLGAGSKLAKTESRGASLCLSSDGILACAGDALVEFMNASGTTVSKRDEKPFPEGLKEDVSILLTKRKGEYVLIPKYSPLREGDLFFVRSNEDLVRKSPYKSSGLISYSPKNDLLFMGVKVRGQVQVYKLPSFEEPYQIDCPPDDIPKTPGVPAKIEYLEANDFLAVLDNQGYFYLARKLKNEKRWQKFLVFSPLK